MKTFRRLMFLMSILSIAGILVACATPGSTGPAENSSTPSLSSTFLAETGNAATPSKTSPAIAGSPAGQATPTPVNTEFARMLGMVPFSFLKDHDVWFGNPENAKEVYGIQDADSAAALQQLSQDQRQQVFEAVGGIAMSIPDGRDNLNPDFAQYFGFDGWMADQLVFPGASFSWNLSASRGPWAFSINDGKYNTDLITSKLTGQGYQKEQYGSFTYYSIGNDFQFDPDSEVAKLGAQASMDRVTLLGNTLITAPATGIMTGILDTMSGKEPSVMDNTTCRDLVSSLGNVLSGVLITPDRVVVPFPGITPGQPYYDFTIPSDWGRLHQYGMIGMGYKDNGQERSWVISLYYADAKDASEDIGLLATRMKSYIFNTPFIDHPGTGFEAIPLTDQFEVGQPSVQTYGSGATLTIECRFKPGTGNDAWLFPTMRMRDLLFLVPDPSPYVTGSSIPSATVGPSYTQQP